MSERSMSGSTGKSVKAIGALPGLTMNRSCFPAASHRKAMVFPSGDHCCSVGYLMSAMRSIVMLPRGACSAKAAWIEDKPVATKKSAEYTFVITFRCLRIFFHDACEPEFQPEHPNGALVMIIWILTSAPGFSSAQLNSPLRYQERQKLKRKAKRAMNGLS